MALLDAQRRLLFGRHRDQRLPRSCRADANGSWHLDRRCGRCALIVGRLCAGWLSDRVFAPYIAVFFVVFPMLGIAVLGFGFAGINPVVGTICLGIGIGIGADSPHVSFGRRQV